MMVVAISFAFSASSVVDIALPDASGLTPLELPPELAAPKNPKTPGPDVSFGGMPARGMPSEEAVRRFQAAMATPQDLRRFVDAAKLDNVAITPKPATAAEAPIVVVEAPKPVDVPHVAIAPKPAISVEAPTVAVEQPKPVVAQAPIAVDAPKPAVAQAPIIADIPVVPSVSVVPDVPVVPLEKYTPVAVAAPVAVSAPVAVESPAKPSFENPLPSAPSAAPRDNFRPVVKAAEQPVAQAPVVAVEQPKPVALEAPVVAIERPKPAAAQAPIAVDAPKPVAVEAPVVAIKQPRPVAAVEAPIAVDAPKPAVAQAPIIPDIPAVPSVSVVPDVPVVPLERHTPTAVTAPVAIGDTAKPSLENPLPSAPSAAPRDNFRPAVQAAEQPMAQALAIAVEQPKPVAMEAPIAVDAPKPAVAEAPIIPVVPAVSVVPVVANVPLEKHTPIAVEVSVAVAAPVAVEAPIAVEPPAKPSFENPLPSAPSAAPRDIFVAASIPVEQPVVQAPTVAVEPPRPATSAESPVVAAEQPRPEVTEVPIVVVEAPKPVDVPHVAIAPKPAISVEAPTVAVEQPKPAAAQSPIAVDAPKPVVAQEDGSPVKPIIPAVPLEKHTPTAVAAPVAVSAPVAVESPAKPSFENPLPSAPSATQRDNFVPVVKAAEQPVAQAPVVAVEPPRPATSVEAPVVAIKQPKPVAAVEAPIAVDAPKPAVAQAPIIADIPVVPSVSVVPDVPVVPLEKYTPAAVAAPITIAAPANLSLENPLPSAPSAAPRGNFVPAVQVAGHPVAQAPVVAAEQPTPVDVPHVAITQKLATSMGAPVVVVELPKQATATETPIVAPKAESPVNTELSVKPIIPENEDKSKTPVDMSAALTAAVAGAPAVAEPVQTSSAQAISDVAAASARTTEILETANEIADAVVAQIVVTPSILKGEGEVLIRLKPTVLDGSEITLSAKDNVLSLAIVPATPEAEQIVSANIPQLERALAEHLPTFGSFVISVAKKGKFNETN